jgi:magnesium transporter
MTQSFDPEHDVATTRRLDLPQSATAVEDEPASLAERIEDIPAADAADVIETLSTEQAAEVAEYLDPDTAAKILAEMDATLAASVIVDMEPPEASMVLGAMDPDDRVDILEHIEKPLRDELLAEMEPAYAAEVRSLEGYAPDTAGGIMTTQVSKLYEYLSVDDAITTLRRMSEELEQMYYVYVIDRRNHLLGVLSMRDLILAKPTSLLRDIMIKEVRSVPATMDQEHVAQLMRRYNYLAMPVVDERHRLIGLITSDDIVDVIEEETTEDVQRMFGAGAEERLASPWAFSFKRRIPWLQVNLATAFLAASVVGIFESTIDQLAIIAVYMPVVAGMGGNASAQSMAVAIRGIAVGEFGRVSIFRVLLKQWLVGM